jgi:hypothetical protein
LQNFETGRTVPKNVIIKALAEKIGINPNDLLNKKLTKKEVPVIVIEKTQASGEDVTFLRKQVEQLQQQNSQLQQQLIEQQQQLIKLLQKDA